MGLNCRPALIKLEEAPEVLDLGNLWVIFHQPLQLSQPRIATNRRFNFYNIYTLPTNSCKSYIIRDCIYYLILELQIV